MTCDECGAEGADHPHGIDGMICDDCFWIHEEEYEMRQDALADEADRRRKINKGE